jgi:hypothetical protein
MASVYVGSGIVNCIPDDGSDLNIVGINLAITGEEIAINKNNTKSINTFLLRYASSNSFFNNEMIICFLVYVGKTGSFAVLKMTLIVVLAILPTSR